MLPFVFISLPDEPWPVYVASKCVGAAMREAPGETKLPK
jgi:hypothetical protein